MSGGEGGEMLTHIHNHKLSPDKLRPGRQDTQASDLDHYGPTLNFDSRLFSRCSQDLRAMV